MASESLTSGCIDEMVAWVEAHVDLDALVSLARTHSAPLDVPPAQASRRAASTVRVGVARDAAFCFYYEDNLDVLRECGAELVEFSPIADKELPAEIGGLYLGGGYPEIHAGQLSANEPMKQAIRRFAESGAPVYAECGGFMYLTEGIVDTSGQEHRMTGLFPTRARMQTRLAALGYRQPESVADTLWLHSEETMRGHEFRYSSMDPMPANVARAYNGSADGHRIHQVLGSYIHLHFLSCPKFAETFVQSCVQWRERSRR